MTSPKPPEDPEKYQRWYLETGEVYVWNGEDWVALDDQGFPPTSPFRGTAPAPSGD